MPVPLRPIFLSLALCCVCTADLLAQLPVHAGIKAGGVWNRKELSLNSVAKIFPATIGGYLEVDLPFLPIVETGVFWKRYQLDNSQPTSAVRANAIEVPILLKKRFTPLPIQPFLSAGTTLRWVPTIQNNGLNVNLSTESGVGLTAAAGLSLKLLVLRVEPEFRATRWLRGNFLPQNNQVEFLVGIRF